MMSVARRAATCVWMNMECARRDASRRFRARLAIRLARNDQLPRPGIFSQSFRRSKLRCRNVASISGSARTTRSRFLLWAACPSVCSRTKTKSCIGKLRQPVEQAEHDAEHDEIPVAVELEVAVSLDDLSGDRGHGEGGDGVEQRILPRCELTACL